jgi:hypothetical protein
VFFLEINARFTPCVSSRKRDTVGVTVKGAECPG